MMTTIMEMDHTASHSGDVAEAERILQQCNALVEPIKRYTDSAGLILDQWDAQVKTKSEEAVEVYGTSEVIAPPYQVFSILKENAEKNVQDIQSLWMHLQERLVRCLTRWKTCQLHRWVGRRTDSTDDASDVEELCVKVNTFLKRLMQCTFTSNFKRVDSLVHGQPPSLSSLRVTPGSSWFSRVWSIVVNALSQMLVVLEQPPPVLVMEQSSKQMADTSSGRSRAGGSSAQASKKEQGKASAKKVVKTSVGVLGGQGFGGGLAITQVAMGLGLNSDLARSSSWDLQDLVKIHCTDVDGTGLRAYEKTLEDLKLEHFTRSGSRDVWQLLYHAVYFIRVAIHGLSLPFQVLSFPLMVSTASNQVSEHTGAHLWHTFTTRNVYDLTNVITLSLKVSSVLEMLNQRLRHISNRKLRDNEQRFLQQKLERAIQDNARNRAKKDFITLYTFVKQGVMVQNPGVKMEFSLWRWLHSIFNLLENTLHQPWADGIIYGFASYKQSIRALVNEAEGTFLFRFSESVLLDNHLLSQGYLSTVVRLAENIGFAEAIGAADIRAYGLAFYLENTKCEVLMGSSLTVQDLVRRYPPIDPPQNPSVYLKWNNPKLQKTNQSPKERIVLMGNPETAVGAPSPTGTAPDRSDHSPFPGSEGLPAQSPPAPGHLRQATSLMDCGSRSPPDQVGGVAGSWPRGAESGIGGGARCQVAVTSVPASAGPVSCTVLSGSPQPPPPTTPPTALLPAMVAGGLLPGSAAATTTIVLIPISTGAVLSGAGCVQASLLSSVLPFHGAARAGGQQGVTCGSSLAAPCGATSPAGGPATSDSGPASSNNVSNLPRLPVFEPEHTARTAAPIPSCPSFCVSPSPNPFSVSRLPAGRGPDPVMSADDSAVTSPGRGRDAVLQGWPSGMQGGPEEELPVLSCSDLSEVLPDVSGFVPESEVMLGMEVWNEDVDMHFSGYF